MVMSPSSEETITSRVILIPTSIVGGGSNPRVGIGVAAGEDDIIPAQLLPALAVGQSFQLDPEGISAKALGGETISFGVDNASTKTTYLVD
ncbi:MAG: hypothetical protein IIC24_12285, partial [Chloroflexi bacterium]|nr:hypothetical protein [Chloroflexota bacterium]